MTLPSETSPASPAEPAPLRWTVHPAARHPARAALLLLVIAVTALLVRAVSGSDLAAGLGALLLLGSLRAWFLPRTYLLDGQGALEEGPLQAPRRLPWEAVRSVSAERHGVHLSPLHRPSRWLADRGLFLRTAGNAEHVTAFVRRQCRA